MLDLEAIKARAAAATAGPWWVEPERPRHNGEMMDAHIAYGTQGIGSDTYDVIDAYDVENDYVFIAHARQDVPALIAEVERLRALVEEVG